MSNSANMTMGERLAQKLKTSPMGELLDEDDLRQLCDQAIKDAFFKPYTTIGDYGRTIPHEAILVTEARRAFRSIIEPIFQEQAKKLAETKEFREVIIQTAVALLPDLMMNSSKAYALAAASDHANAAISRINEMAREGILGKT